MPRATLALTIMTMALSSSAAGAQRMRARDMGVRPGVFQPGTYNAITDVAGVKVGHATVIEGDSVRTGVTAILPHGGNLFTDRVPAALHVGNGFGKITGDVVSCAVRGPVGPLLTWLSAGQVVELDSRELSLEEVFLTEFAPGTESTSGTELAPAPPR